MSASICVAAGRMSISWKDVPRYWHSRVAFVFVRSDVAKPGSV